MSRRDSRRAMPVRLPDDLRRRLVKMSPAHLPLSYLMRHAFRAALETNPDWESLVDPGSTRPIMIKLAPQERDALEAAAAARGISTEVALLSMVATVV